MIGRLRVGHGKRTSRSVSSSTRQETVRRPTEPSHEEGKEKEEEEAGLGQNGLTVFCIRHRRLLAPKSRDTVPGIIEQAARYPRETLSRVGRIPRDEFLSRTPSRARARSSVVTSVRTHPALPRTQTESTIRPIERIVRHLRRGPARCRCE